MEKIDTAFSAEKIVNDLFTKKKLVDEQFMDFSMECIGMLLTTVGKLQNKSHLKYSMVRNMEYPEPRKMTKHPDAAKYNFKSVYWLQAGSLWIKL